MATRSGNVAPSNSTDAYFRAWGKWISDCFSAFGWVQTSDTGQIDWATVLAPTAALTVKGYEIWRMADALQATAPVFLKIEYGSAGTIAYPWIAITVGTGSDGSGAITGVLFSRTHVYSGGNSSSAFPCYASGSTNRFDIFMFKSTSSYHLFFSIERMHDATGADVNTGFQVYLNPSYLSAPWTSRECHFSGSNPAAFSFWNHSQFPPSGSGALSPDIHCYPIRCWTPGESYPSLNLVAYVSTDFADGSTYAVTGYDGTSRTYIAIGGTQPGNLNGQTIQQAGRYMMRYD